MVLGFLRPADEEAAEAVELDHPAAGAEAGFALERSRFFTARADVGAEAERVGEFVDLGVVVALVQAKPMGPLGGVRPVDHDLFECRAEELEVVDVGTRDLEPDRDAAAFAEERALRPLLALSVGLGPVSRVCPIFCVGVV